MHQRWVIVTVAVVLVAAGVLYWLYRPTAPLSDRAVLSKAAFSDLQGWQTSDLQPSFLAFRRSCDRFARLPVDRSLGSDGIAGRVADWRLVCELWGAVEATNSASVRRYFERWFIPVAIANNDQTSGLFTGYYEPELRGSRQKKGRFDIPIYARPKDLVMVELGRFRKQLRGQRIAGRVVDGRLQPFETRAAIEAGALADRGLELLWVDDAIEAFFLHIQGSGRVVLDNGEVERVGYAGQNGHAYFAIGRELIARGALDRDNVSLQTIRAWLTANPEEARAVMNKNASFVFFQRIKGDGPIGAFQVALTPSASLAIDRRFVPLGVPVWLETFIPEANGEKVENPVPWRGLLVAQDTGGAIRGVVRGDIFFGAGSGAEAIAGRLKSPGRYFILLPRTVVDRGDPWPELQAD